MIALRKFRELRLVWPAIILIASLVAFSPVRSAALTPAQLNAANIRYEVRPIMAENMLQSVRITVRLIGQASGQTKMMLPNETYGQKQLYRYIGPPRVRGGTLAVTAQDKWVITHSPRAALTVSYDITSAFEAEPDITTMMETPFAPIIRPNWFSFIGATTFVRLSVDDQTPVHFSWHGTPRGWKVASDLEHSGLTYGLLHNSSLIG